MSRRVLIDRRQGTVTGTITGVPANQTALSVRDDLAVTGSVSSSSTLEWVYSRDGGSSWVVFDPAGKVRDIFWKTSTPDFTDEFTSLPASPTWQLYTGAGHLGNGVWNTSQVAVASGNLELTGASDVTNGLKTGGLLLLRESTFARARVNVRADVDASLTFRALVYFKSYDNTSFAAPVPGGEIDFVEMPASTAATRTVRAVVHGNTDGLNDIGTQVAYAGDNGENFVEYICERSPGRVDFYTGSTYVGSVVDAPSSPVPKGPMHLAIQFDAQQPTYSGSAVKMQVGVAEICHLHNAPILVKARLVGNPAISSDTATVTLQGAASQVSMTTDLPATSERANGGLVSLAAAWTPACSYQVQERATSSDAWVNSSGTGASGFGTSLSFGAAVAAVDGKQYRVKLTSGGYYYYSTTTTMDVAAPAVPTASVRGWFLGTDNSGSQTLDSADFVNASGSVSLVSGDKILLLVAAPGPSDVGSPTFTIPGSEVFTAPGSSYRPRLFGYELDYTTPDTWDITSSTSFRIAAIAFSDCESITAGTPSSNTTPVDPTGIPNSDKSVGVAITTLNFTSGAVTAAPAGHTTLFNSGLKVRQLYAAKLDLPVAGVYDPAAATVGPSAEQGTTIAVVASPTAPSGGGGDIDAPTLPTFNSGDYVTVNPGDNLASIVAASLPGKTFLLTAGSHNVNDVRPKTGQLFWGPVSGLATCDGTGKAYGFRAGANGTSDNVFIGRNIKMQNYGLGTTRAEYGAIQAQPTDTVGGQYTYGHADNWFIYDVEFANNASNGLRMSDNCTVYQCWAWGHTVTGFGCDRGVGGLIYDCLLEANGWDPAPGAGANGANIKITWHNANEGRTDVIPSAYQRSKAVCRVVNSTFNATKSGSPGACAIGMWFDLDCQQTEVLDCEFNNHSTTSIFWEGCNGGLAQGNTVNNSDGFGPAYGSNFINGALACGESTNIIFDGNTVNDSDYALVNRMSNRTGDWINSNNNSYVNFGWPTASGGNRYWLTYGSPTPVPTTSQRSNVWTGNNIFRNNVLVNCNKVVINEGTNGGGQNAQGSTPVSSIQFQNNDYSGSTITFYHLSNTGINLAAWRALPYDRDQV